METAKEILRKILETIFYKYDFDFEIEEGDEVGYFTIRIKSKTNDTISKKYEMAIMGSGKYVEPILLYSKSLEEYEKIGTSHLIEKCLILENNFWEKMFMYHLFD